MRKLGIKEGWRMALLNKPEGFESLIEPLPDGVQVKERLGSELDFVLLFTTRAADLERRFPQVTRWLQPAGSFWVAWPKRASRVPTDLTENTVRDIALANRMVDNKVCAIDDVWSGLRLVVRLADRESW
ncbi:MAG: DUF3052 domain-containing protein [Actinomycetota bacterium]|nr:DUF3052 domain-containing protein [Actinomycetota bacterium]